MGASSSQGGGSSGGQVAENPSPAPAGTVAGQEPANPTDAPDATGAQAQAEAGDLGDVGAESLPFTGSRILPLVLLAVLILLAGMGLRRAVRDPA